jgi:hypothetical protein
VRTYASVFCSSTGEVPQKGERAASIKAKGLLFVRLRGPEQLQAKEDAAKAEDPTMKAAEEAVKRRSSRLRVLTLDM